MQMLATNEQEEPWLDEGFTSYFEAKILDKFYPEGTVSWPYMSMKVGSEELRRGRFLNAENIKVNPLSDFGWHFKHGSYAQIVYGKAAVGLSTLEGLVGEEVMQKIMLRYFTDWKFKHPGRQAFIEAALRVVEAELGPNQRTVIDHFLQQLIFGTAECDYAVNDIINQEISAPVGFFVNTEDCKTSLTPDEIVYENKAILFRHGEFIVPQEVKITFDDGEEKWEQWDGQARSKEWVYVTSKKMVSVEIDPLGKIPLDSNLINNSKTLNPEQSGITRYFTAMLTWLQAAMVSMATLV
jgi:aminopeptidase N